MSLGYSGLCVKVMEDDEVAIYSYAGENLNDGVSKIGDALLQDGMITIYKRCLEEPEIHSRLRQCHQEKRSWLRKEYHIFRPLMSIYKMAIL